jgi:hypothetical protein
MLPDPDRRTALVALGVVAGAAALPTSAGHAAKASDAWMPQGALTLKDLHQALDKAARRRDFKTVPMTLDSKDYWDHEALTELIAYGGGPKQIWDNKNLGGPWTNLMRNNLNVQTVSFKRPDFLIISATHAAAHLALYDQAIWDKYQLTKLAGADFPRNSFILEETAGGVFSPEEKSIPALQRRGAVFLGCHNSIWEQTAALMQKGINPDKLSHEAMAAELTNHLIADVVLTPGAVATLLYFQEAGFHYAT